MKAAIPLFILSLLSFSLLFPAEKESGIVAKVNGVAITAKALEEKVNITVNQSYFHRNITPEKKTALRQQAFESLLESELFYQEAVKQDLTVPKAVLDKEYGKVLKRFPSKEDFENALKRTGYTPVTLRKKLEKDALVQLFIKRNIIEKNVFTEKDLLDYYNKNKHKFKKPETLKLQLILVKVRPPANQKARDFAKKRAQFVLGKIKAGEDFGELARKFSDDRYRIKGGHLGEIHRGRLPKQVEPVAFSMKVGDISPIIETDLGFSIIKLLGKKAARQFAFSEVQKKLKAELTQNSIARSKKKILAGLKARAKIEVYIDFTK